MKTQHTKTWGSADAATPTATVVANQVQRRQPTTSRELSRPRSLSLGRRSLRVLIVDNDQDMADELGWSLHRGGHNPRVAYDGQSALRLAAKQHPHLVLMNVELPQMDGCQVAKQLRLDFPRSECFIIGITWRTDAQRRSQSIEAGIDLLLIKPVELFLMETLLQLETVRVQRLRAENTVRCIGNDDLNLQK